MTRRHPFRASIISVVLVFVFLGGCSEKKLYTLDKDDIRFVEFYSDYLLLSGVVVEHDTEVLTVLNSDEINKILVRHELTRESLQRKTEAYKHNPELWRSVLLQVRENLRKKSTTEQ